MEIFFPSFDGPNNVLTSDISWTDGRADVPNKSPSRPVFIFHIFHHKMCNEWNRAPFSALLLNDIGRIDHQNLSRVCVCCVPLCKTPTLCKIDIPRANNSCDSHTRLSLTRKWACDEINWPKANGSRWLGILAQSNVHAQHESNMVRYAIFTRLTSTRTPGSDCLWVTATYIEKAHHIWRILSINVQLG